MPDEPVKTAYELLHVHPAAPGELLNTSYWLQVGDLQKRREAGENVDARLHQVTVAYQHVSDPVSRASYNSTMGIAVEEIAAGPIPKRKKPLRFLPGGQRPRLDYYAVLGVASATPAHLVEQAYRIMRDQYLHLSSAKGRREAFLSLLDEAYSVIRDEQLRSAYDATRMIQAPGANGRIETPPPGRTQPEARQTPPAPTKAVAKTPVSPRSPKRSEPAASEATSPAKSRQTLKEDKPKEPDSPASPSRWLKSLRQPKTDPAVEKKVPPAALKPASAAVRPPKPAPRTEVASERRVKTAQTKLTAPPAVSQKRQPRPRNPLDKTEVEEALLGRLAASVKEHARNSNGEAQPGITPPPGT